MSNRRTDVDAKKDWIIGQLKLGVPQAVVARELKCKIDTLRTRLKDWGVSHFRNQSGAGRPKVNGRRHVSEYLGIGKQVIRTHKLKLILWRDGYKEKNCEVCGLTEWQGKEAPLELDHINGDNWDNSLENLRIICPNCHAQTLTNSGKNIGKNIGKSFKPT